VPSFSQIRFIIKDTLLVIGSVFIAIGLVRYGVLDAILFATGNIKILSSFIAGLFFTSMFTTAPSIAAFSEISLTFSPWLVAFFGACGATIGDSIILFFIRRGAGKAKAVRTRARRHPIYKLKVFRWMMAIVGAIIIATPIPDEIGLTLMGLSRTNIKILLPVAFLMNFLGILAIGLAANAIVMP